MPANDAALSPNPSAVRTHVLGVDKAALPLIVSVLLLFAVGGSIVWLVGSSGRQTTTVVQVFEAQRAASRLFRTVLGAESGQRGFLLTGDEQYLTPYTNAVRSIGDATQDLRTVTRVDPLLAREADALKGLVERKMAELAQTIEFQRAGKSTDALALVKDNVGRDLMVQIRAGVDRIQGGVNRTIDVEYAEAQSLNRTLLLTSLAALVALVVLAGVVLRVYRRSMIAAEEGRAATAQMNTSLEQAVLERTTELMESNEEIQRFAYIVSHDLRAPLVNVMGFTSELEALKDEMIGGQVKLPPDRAAADRARLVGEFDESIGFIKAAINKMEGLIAAILRLSREGRRTFRPEPIDTTRLCESLADAQRHQADAAGATVVVEQGLPALVADRVAIEQIFGNLLDNAIKYLDPSRSGRIEISGATIGSRARISVRDNGRGIADQDHKRVFELFRRSGEQNRPGDGIGLAHVQTLVRSLGGRITVASKLGEGTTFTVVLPLSPPSPVPNASV